jgi:hypothetical protein
VAGLGLNVGGFGAIGTAVPAPAAQPTYGSTVGQQAFGVFSSQTAGPSRAGFGTVLLGASAAGLLVWIWWTLPR